MSTGTDVVLPSLYGDLERVDVTDIQLPSIYLMADLSTAVKADLARPGDALIMLGKDDGDPVYAIDRKGYGGEPRDHFDAYIIARQRKVAYIAGQEFEFLDDNMVVERGNPEHQDVWVGYNYMLAIPDLYPGVPVRQLLIKTGGKFAFTKINYWLTAAQAARATDPVHVRYTTKTQYSKNAKTDYWVYDVKQIPTNPDTVEQARAMFAFVDSFKTENDAPAKDTAGTPAF